MPIYTNDPYDDDFIHYHLPLNSSVGVGPKVTESIDKATKEWLDEHPEATTTVEDDSISNKKLMDGSVNSRTIANESITTDDIANDAVTFDKLASGSVRSTTIEDGSITTPKLADRVVTNTKLENGAVDSNKLANASVGSSKLASDAINALPVMSTSARGVARVGAGLAMNDDKIELDGSGDIATAVLSWMDAHPEASTTVEDGAVSTAKLTDLAVTISKLANNAVSEEKLVAALNASLIKGRGWNTDVSLVDANQVERNSIIWIGSKNDVANLPSGLQTEGCILITIGNGKTTHANSPAFQMCLTISKANTEVSVMGFWYRSRWGASSSVWSTWACVYSSADGNISDATITEAKLETALAKALIKGRGYDDDAGTALTDANAAERNSVVMVWMKEHVQNLPSDLSSEDGCFLVTIGNGKQTGATSTCMQLCVSVTKKTADAANYKACIWCRSRYGAASQDWSAWVKLTSSIDGVTIDDLSTSLTKKLLVSQGFVNDSSEPLDANTVTRGTVYFITSTASVSNLPAEAGANPMGYLVSFATGTGNIGATSATFQMFAECQPHSEAYGPWFGGLWYRSRYGASTDTWSEWVQVVTSNDATMLSDVSMFRKIGVLGDSFASGTMYANGTFIRQDYEQAWPKNMARQHGIEVERYSASGWGCYDWINRTGSYGLDKFLADVDGGNVCGLYLICFGINDSNPSHSMGGVSGGLDYIGSEADVNESDYTQNANSYWGQLSRIICTIQDRCPDSKIIVSTLARENNATRKAYTEAVKEIADHWGVPYIYLYGDTYFASPWWNNGMDGSHPTAPMYAGMAVAMNRLISRCIGSHYSYFKTYAGIEGA